MAVDTRNRRASAIGAGLMFLALLPAPDGSIADGGDRQQVVGLYAGISSVAPAVLPDDIQVTSIRAVGPRRTIRATGPERRIARVGPRRTIRFIG